MDSDSSVHFKPNNYMLHELSNIEYDDPEMYGKSYIAKAVYSGKKIIIESTKLSCPKGVIDRDGAKYLDLVFDKGDNDFYYFLGELNEYNVLEVFKKSKKWFGKRMSMDDVDDHYRSIVQLRQVPSFRIRIPDDVSVHNQYRKPLTMADIDFNLPISIGMEYNGIRFGKQQCMADFKLLDIRVHQQRKRYEEDEEEDGFFEPLNKEKLIVKEEEPELNHNSQEDTSKDTNVETKEIVESELINKEPKEAVISPSPQISEASTLKKGKTNKAASKTDSLRRYNKIVRSKGRTRVL